MGNIILLDDLTINQIAAGEVIERPASVIKELVENSIDAGANNISVDIKNGGISYIRITDNGKGIMPDDMEIAFERHATSKIRQAEDLNHVRSMGFRGEALASIAAIAKVTMVSRTKDMDFGNRIVLEGGKIVEKAEVGCPIGTTITVENLFFNTPVRYKFLKKDFTELGYVEDTITRIALVNPEIAIKLVSLGKVVLQTSGTGDIKNVVYSIFGKEVARNIIPVRYEYDNYLVTGVVGKPCIARSNRSNQIFFVNKRFVKDKTLTSATEKAFKGLLTIGKFGFVILNIDMQPEQVDVNVHPAKLEVRFQEEQKVFKAIYHAINDTLLREDLIAETKKLEELPEDEKARMSFGASEKMLEKIKKEVEQLKTGVENFGQERIFQKEVNITMENLNEAAEKEALKMYDSEKDKKSVFERMYKDTFKTEGKVEESNAPFKYDVEEIMPEKVENISIFSKDVPLEKINYKFIGIAFSTYIIIEIDRDLYIIDQHAAHERIMYEKIKANYYNDHNKEAQLMLLPDIINLTHKEMEIARENKELFERAGFEFTEFGENTIKLNGVPNVCIDLNTKELFLETLDGINNVGRTAKDELEEKFIATVACKAAVKANMALTEKEVKNLMDDLLSLVNPFTCPHGRPTAIRMSKTDFEKRFSRR